VSLEDRPYVGTWRLNNQEVYRHTPDALVYVNGDTAIPGCAACNGRIDLQPFITSVSVDPSVNPIATSSITLQIPRQFGDQFVRDGNFLLQTGLEIHIYMRGYFPVTGMYAASTPNETGGVDITNAALHPYYLVFHGVVTEVSHEYSGGEHTASLSCADLLHFWQYQRMSTNASLFGARPHNSKVRMSLVGHNFTAMSPFGIIYTLFRDTMGAAGGVEFALGSESTAAADSSASGESLFSLSILYWQKRFAQSLTKLRIYGADGTLYNSFQQSFLANMTNRDLKDLPAQGLGDRTSAQAKSYDPFLSLLRSSIEAGSLVEAATSEEDAEKGGAGVNMTQLQAFSTDISNWGQVNLFESSYETKLDLAQAVTEVTGFEFYQDPSGDIVFKPPFYNLDTSSSRVYRIKPIDIISFSTSEGEPEATVMKGTGSWFQNVGGTGLEGEWGTRAEFMDYRMVAKYGWRQETFETSYFTDPRAIYFAAINRLDLHNIAVKSASCTIPLRPELRPGYPVYIEHLDCFYYLQSFSHNFSYGGQCDTTLQLVGKRAKFYAPGKVSQIEGRKANIDDIDLSNTFLPVLPLEVEGHDGIHRLQGFPNVVMALDPELLNPLFSIVGINLEDLDTEFGLQTLIKAAMMSQDPVLLIDEDKVQGTDMRSLMFEGPYKIQSSDGGFIEVSSFSALLDQAVDYREVQDQLSDPTTTDQDREQLLESLEGDNFGAIVALVESVQSRMKESLPDADSSAAYLELLNDKKSMFNPGGSLPGYYRYYSASHPEPSQQGQEQLAVDPDTGQLVPGGLTGPGEGAVTVFGFATGVAEGAVLEKDRTVSAGLPIMQPGTKEAIPTPTSLIHTLMFAKHLVPKEQGKNLVTGKSLFTFNASTYSGALNQFLYLDRVVSNDGLDAKVRDTFESTFDTILAGFTSVFPPERTSVVVVGDAPTFDGILGDDIANAALGDVGANGRPIVKGGDEDEKLRTVAALLGLGLSHYTAKVFATWQRDLQTSLGPEGGTLLGGGTAEAKDEAYAELHQTLAALNTTLNIEADGGVAAPPAKRTKGKTIDVDYYSPVFPVSDERGYEVIGNYRYGRGLSVEPGGNFDQLNQVSNLNLLSVATVDEVVVGLMKEGDLSKALGTLSEVAAAELAANFDITEEMLAAEGPGILERGLATWFANSKQSTQKVTATNAAYNLQRLGQHASQGVCTCKGSEADLLLLAFGEDAQPQYLAVDQPDEVSEWLSSQAVERSVPWKASQDALRGTVLDLEYTSVVDVLTNAFGGQGALQSGINQAGAGLAAQGEALADLDFGGDEG
jgi:hypothetical protein